MTTLLLNHHHKTPYNGGYGSVTTATGGTPRSLRDEGESSPVAVYQLTLELAKSRTPSLKLERGALGNLPLD